MAETQDRSRRAIVLALRMILAAAGLSAVAALVLEYGGFRALPWWLGVPVLHTVQKAIVGVFVGDRLLRLALARRRLRYLRENWIDYVLIVLAGTAMAFAPQFETSVLPAAAIFVIITQVYLLVALILRAVSINLSLSGSGIRPSALLIGSFGFLILAGTGLLMLPAATPDGRPIQFEDALFTATSATCVTGLIVRDTGADFTIFGQAVILVLIQLGGLGIMLFGTMLAMLVGKGLSVRGSSAMGEMLATQRVGELSRVVLFVVLFTLALEAAGAVLLYPMFASGGGEPVATARAIWQSVFHSISAFCNAGFSLFGANMMHGVREGWISPLRDRWQTLYVMGTLIILGGLGFPVLQDCVRYGRDALRAAARRFVAAAARRPVPRPRLNLHSKIVLSTSALLIVFGAVALLLIEPRAGAREAKAIGRNAFAANLDVQRSGDWGNLPPAPRLREAVFQSVSARTAGFNTIDMAELSDGGKFWMCGLMVVGGSPASTAGGMKTVTFALLLIVAFSVLMRRRDVEAYRRSLAADILRRALTLAVLYVSLVCLVTLLLCVSMRGDASFIDLLFESCSACGTVGLSAGVTSHLNTFAKYVIVGAMFIGRIGPLTLLLALTSKRRHVPYAYPQETVLIG